MPPQILNEQHYVESARVYMRRDSSILIKCCLCNADTFSGSEWKDFFRHLLQRHGGARQWNGDEDEIQREVQVELANLIESGITHDSQMADEKAEEQEFYTNVEYLEEEQENKELICSSESDQDNNEPGINSPDGYIVYKPNRPFFSLQRTSPTIIQYFIELLRRHKFLWSNSLGINRKDRLESSHKVAKSLQHRFSVLLEPQVVNASARFLQVWFERQYVMQLSNSAFRCRYPKYYRSLLGFMPTNHISVTICEECDRRFLNEHQLRLHKFSVHGGPNPNTCHVCKQAFPLASKLQQHQARYHFKPLEWQCGQCDYNAPSKWDFQQHQAMHLGLRNYTCEVCGQSCKTSSALAVHRRTHDQPKLSCPHCSRQFRENYVLKCHIRKFHEDDNARRFSCNICLRRFQTAEILKLHEFVHSQNEEKESEEEDL
ncbi:oocyte zinc finger protein XlCOF28 [Drosophila eugracilis]|uniref:oocyte zinc finger protein XlCOF28 n=1 Tax=Drosophila eugracilis TaxID=29029 RepID=UPI0007E6DD9C|nr:oocyte zinc finger protein XlCOF28 [Drosophila eugracilis]